jgi:hypothetical protein
MIRLIRDGCRHPKVMDFSSLSERIKIEGRCAHSDAWPACFVSKLYSRRGKLY